MERVLQETGPCGRFQVCHVIMTELCRFVAMWALYLMVFGLYNPGWRCLQSNATALGFPNDTTLDFGQSQAGAAGRLLSTLTLKPGNETLVKMLHDPYNGTCDTLASCAGGRVEFNPSSSTIVTEFGLYCGKIWIGHLIVSVFNGGQLVGALFWGQFGERFGRKRSLYLSNVATMLPIGLAVFSPSWEVYASFMFLIGFGCASVPSIGSILNTEFLNAKWRAGMVSIPVLNLGTVFFALLTFILKDWRHVHLATTFAMSAICLGYFWTPESLRWLIIHGKTSEAEKVVEKIARMNKKPISQETLDVAMKNDADEDKGRHYTYLDLFKSREMRLLTIGLGAIRFVSLFVYEMIGFAIQSLPGNFYTNMITSGLIDLPLAVTRGPLANRIGRRYAGVTYTALGVLSSACLITALLTLDPSNRIRGQIVTGMALINKSAMYGSIGIHSLAVIELMPTAVRNVSFGLYNTIARIVSIAGPFLLPTDGPSMVAFFAVFLVFQAIATVAYLLLQETKDKPLKDTLQAKNGQSSSFSSSTPRSDEDNNAQIAVISFKRLN